MSPRPRRASTRRASAASATNCHWCFRACGRSAASTRRSCKIPGCAAGSRSAWTAARTVSSRSAAMFRRAAGDASNAAESSAIDFEQAGAALAAADAHRHHAPLGLAPTTFLQDVAGQPRAGHSEGMADRDRAAVDIVLFRIDAELVARVQALAGKRLVELPDIDILHLHAGALEKLRHGVDRADTHLVRLAAGRSPGDEAAKRLKAALFRVLGFH